MTDQFKTILKSFSPPIILDAYHFSRRSILNLKRNNLKGFSANTDKDLDAYLAKKEKIFKAPPFTKEFVEAIKFLGPQKLDPNEKCRAFWEVDQNAACWGEYEAMEKFLDVLDKPKKVLEIGPGLGRSTIFLKKKLSWDDVMFHLFEGDGAKPRYKMLGKRFDDSFCGNISLLTKVLKYNNISTVRSSPA